MRIYLNTQEYEVEEGITLSELLRSLKRDNGKNVVTVDRRFVSPQDRATLVLKEGSMVDITPDF